MLKSGIDQDALIAQFANASAKQTEQLREGVMSATLQALQGREVSLKNIRSVIKSVTEAASAGLAQNPASPLDAEAMISSTLAGLDQAVLKAVDAHRAALTQLTAQGADLHEKQLEKALGELDKLEDGFFSAVRKAAGSAGAQGLSGPWEQALGQFKAAGSQAGAQAHATAETMLQQMQTTLRSTRNAQVKAAQVLAQSYTALVSGVLIGLSDAMRQNAAAAAVVEPAKPARKTRKAVP